MFAKLALELFDLGYLPIPLEGKRPNVKGWAAADLTHEKIAYWAGNGQAEANVGILCGVGTTSAVYAADFDIYDAAVAERVLTSFRERFGMGPVRIGRAPKVLAVYAGPPGQKKLQATLRAPDGATHKFELLGAGQQFAAFGRHPDTGQQYQWPEERLYEVEPWELPRLDFAAVRDWMRVTLPGLLPAGWTIDGTAETSQAGASGDPLVNLTPPLDIDAAGIERMLAVLDPDMPHDDWLKVGMGLHHQFGGAQEGFRLWDEWSSAGKKYDAAVLRQKWKSFDESGAVRPVTVASVIRMARETGRLAEIDPAAAQSALEEWQDKIAACDDARALQTLAERGMAYDARLKDVDRALLVEAMQRRAHELSGVRLGKDKVARWLKKRGTQPLPDLSEDGRPKETEDNLRVLCANLGVTIRYNVIRKDDEILIPGAAWSIDNRRPASLTWLRGQCHKVDMPTRHINRFVTLLADRNPYNPVAEWITSKPWDGISRLPAFFDTVTENAEECTRQMKELLMRRWMVGAVAAAMSPNGTTMRGVLVFQGEQYTGKTRWIDALVPKHLELVKTGKSLLVHDKDSVKQILSCWIAELGELDATFKKSDIAALKAFITNDIDELRKPYAEAESQFPRRTVFAASVNSKQFLQDDTGNSRFWVLPITRINPDHGMDMQQVWAEVHALWQSGEKHWLEADEMRALNAHNETFTATDPIAEMVATHLDWEHFSLTDCQWMTVSDVLRWLGHTKPTRWEVTTAGKAIQQLNGGHTRKSNGKKLCAVPKKRVELGWQFEDEKQGNWVTAGQLNQHGSYPADCPF
ncbi:MAG: PriCT-2 domain-containing protein [Verrucomicrobiae bacterium]|nr:PriCT-2 domain-containing protein [Verrucomicrobiae bacterium]